VEFFVSSITFAKIFRAVFPAVVHQSDETAPLSSAIITMPIGRAALNYSLPSLFSPSRQLSQSPTGRSRILPGARLERRSEDQAANGCQSIDRAGQGIDEPNGRIEEHIRSLGSSPAAGDNMMPFLAYSQTNYAVERKVKIEGCRM
jgi:hypothetical protein